MYMHCVINLSALLVNYRIDETNQITAMQSMNADDTEGNVGYDFLTKGDAVRAVVGVTCGLSIVGATLIVLSYTCFKNLRTKARRILVHLSIMDFGVATANMVGVLVYFDGYYSVISRGNGSVSLIVMPPSAEIENLCITQAFFAVYFTLGSILWTICLAIYLYFTLVFYDKKHGQYFERFAYVFSYGLPLLVSLWLVLTEKLGYSPYNSAGWCALILVDPATHKRDIYTAILGYDLWIYLTLTLVPLVYLSLKGYVNDYVSTMVCAALCTAGLSLWCISG